MLPEIHTIHRELRTQYCQKDFNCFEFGVLNSQIKIIFFVLKE